MINLPEKRDTTNPVLGPSSISRDGFLGNDTRPMELIIAHDAQDLAAAGISREQIVSLMRIVFAKARAAFGAPVHLGGHAVAVYHESRGIIPSPFGDDGAFEKGEVVVEPLSGEISPLIITQLGIHLIHTRGFFQGRGSRYRINPLEVKKLLGFLL